SQIRHVLSWIVPMLWMRDYQLNLATQGVRSDLIGFEEVLRTLRDGRMEGDYVPVAVRPRRPFSAAAREPYSCRTGRHELIDEGKNCLFGPRRYSFLAGYALSFRFPSRLCHNSLLARPRPPPRVGDPQSNTLNRGYVAFILHGAAASRWQPLKLLVIICCDMDATCLKGRQPNSLILLASPAGFEPATCGLEIRCCYPTELRGRDGEAFTPRSPSSASAAKAGFCQTARRSAA